MRLVQSVPASRQIPANLAVARRNLPYGNAAREGANRKERGSATRSNVRTAERVKKFGAFENGMLRRLRAALLSFGQRIRESLIRDCLRRLLRIPRKITADTPATTCATAKWSRCSASRSGR